MARKRIPKNRLGAATEHSLSRLRYQCGFEGSEGDARKFIAKCRRAAGKNGSLIISAQNLGVGKNEMHGVPDNEFTVAFSKGKLPTVIPLGLP